MSRVCPQGHTSSTDDFCDVCGTPISHEPPPTMPTPPPGPGPASTPKAAPAPQPAAGGEPKVCPNCQAENSADALFCEDCGYDFTTGQLPPPSPVVDPASGQARAATGSAAVAPSLTGVDWVAEVWVDPDWFTHQRAEGRCPTSGLPTVVPLKGTVALVGRRSRSRNINPEIDCPDDSAISHRHAELRRMGERWSVKDLGSTNGTYVGRPGAGYPDNGLPEHEPRELDSDERVYLGAWTRIVVRKATEAERSGT